MRGDRRFYLVDERGRMVNGKHLGAVNEVMAEADGGSAVDRGEKGALSVISRASLGELAREAGVGSVDGRRFRMSIELEGACAFEEDEWMGREVLIGAARVVLGGHVGRCIVTSRHPEIGVVDLPTLDHLRSLRAGAATTEPLALGVYGSVLEGGV